MNDIGKSLTDSDFIQLLRAVHEYEVSQAPTQHRLRTPNCPQLSRWEGQDWTTEEQAHRSGCSYCVKIDKMYQEAMQEGN